MREVADSQALFGQVIAHVDVQNSGSHFSAPELIVSIIRADEREIKAFACTYKVQWLPEDNPCCELSPPER